MPGGPLLWGAFGPPKGTVGQARSLAPRNEPKAGPADSVQQLATLRVPLRWVPDLNKGWKPWVLATSTLAMQPRPFNPVARRSAREKFDRAPPIFAARCRSRAANFAAMSRRRKNWCGWSVAVSARSGWTRRPPNPSNPISKLEILDWLPQRGLDQPPRLGRSRITE